MPLSDSALGTPPILDGTYDTPAFAVGLALRDQYVYVADDDSGLHVIDISEPHNPTRVGGWHTPGEALDVVIRDGLAYVANGAAGLQIVDVSDVRNPIRLGGYDTAGLARAVWLDGNYAYIADGTNGLEVLSVASRQRAARRALANARGLCVEGEHVFVAADTEGVASFSLFRPEPKPTVRLQSPVMIERNRVRLSVSGDAGLPVVIQRSSDLKVWQNWFSVRVGSTLATNMVDEAAISPWLYRAVAPY